MMKSFLLRVHCIKITDIYHAVVSFSFNSKNFKISFLISTLIQLSFMSVLLSFHECAIYALPFDADIQLYSIVVKKNEEHYFNFPVFV